MLELLTRCEDDAYKAVEHDQGGNPDDLALSQARVTMLNHTYEYVKAAVRLRGGDDATP